MEMDIIKHIKDLMDERGWTNYRLGKEAGLSQSTITNLFNRNNAPTIPTLEAVCRRQLIPNNRTGLLPTAPDRTLHQHRLEHNRKRII